MILLAFTLSPMLTISHSRPVSYTHLGFCSPGFIMNVLSMVRELDDPTEEEIKEYLAGNLCRCSGYMSQLRAVKNYLAYKKAQREGGNA